MLMAENARWDAAGKLDESMGQYLSFCDDEKPVTVRQCIQSLCKIVPYKPACLAGIADKLISIDVMQRKDTHRKILLMDILSVLVMIQKLQPEERIQGYIHQALTGGILDAQSKRRVESL